MGLRWFLKFCATLCGNAKCEGWRLFRWENLFNLRFYAILGNFEKVDRKRVDMRPYFLTKFCLGTLSLFSRTRQLKSVNNNRK